MTKILTPFIAFAISFISPIAEAPAPSTNAPIETFVIMEVVEEPTTPKEYARSVVIDRWHEDQWPFFDDLIDKESDWNPDAQNPTSSAFGIGQFLDSTWETVGCNKTKDPLKQVDCTIDYVEKNYETPQKALAFWISQASDPLNPTDGWY